MARVAGGRFLLRIEDIDRQRSKPEWETRILDDLTWLGLTWDTPPMRQSDRLHTYASALDNLWARGLLYPCTCTRRDIAEAMAAPQEDVTFGPDGPVYPGTCRGTGRTGPRPADRHLRLDMAKAARHPLTFRETGTGAGEVTTTPAQYATEIGDIVLARRDFGTSYHLSVVLDDAEQGITHVVRGADLFEATRIHVLLQHLLGLPTPAYHHHALVRDTAGKRLAKRDDARSLSSYREAGWSPEAIRSILADGLTVP
ncbi:Glutamate--tRNA ligase [Jannaschia aquimarina]|uniref:GltX_2 protein n=2 Tax=Jannaschia aquimarina TaxID=935700 RepID=A0A0D1EDY4_9RHOB|nr:Glutamate--tRNA ligase [Jannaschia aquimarina]SNS97216.1 glutamyl-Q tRNA(Asp) synthetase [Jannaschia aquimarina]